MVTIPPARCLRPMHPARRRASSDAFANVPVSGKARARDPMKTFADSPGQMGMEIQHMQQPAG